MNGWIDYLDLPLLQSIQLGYWTLPGDGKNTQYNTMTMRSENERVDEWVDLPLLTEFKGNGGNFHNIGSVILESMDLVID